MYTSKSIFWVISKLCANGETLYVPKDIGAAAITKDDAKPFTSRSAALTFLVQECNPSWQNDARIVKTTRTIKSIRPIPEAPKVQDGAKKDSASDIMRFLDTILGGPPPASVKDTQRDPFAALLADIMRSGTKGPLNAPKGYYDTDKVKADFGTSPKAQEPGKESDNEYRNRLGNNCNGTPCYCIDLINAGGDMLDAIGAKCSPPMPRKGAPQAVSAENTPDASGMTPNEIKQCKNGERIPAIKGIRARTGMSLKEAKDLTEKVVPYNPSTAGRLL